MKYRPIFLNIIFFIIEFLKKNVPKDKIILTPISASFPKCSNFASGTKFEILSKSFPNSTSAETKEIKIVAQNGKEFDTICFVNENLTEPVINCELAENVTGIKDNSKLTLNVSEDVKFNVSNVIIKNFTLKNFATFNSKANFEIIDSKRTFKFVVGEKNESIFFDFSNDLNELNVKFKIENFSKNLDCEIYSENHSKVICNISNKIAFTNNYETYNLKYQDPCGNWNDLQTTINARLKTNVSINITNVTFHDYYCSRFTQSTHFEILTDTNNIQTFTTGYNSEFYLTDKNASVKIGAECFIGNEEINSKIFCKTTENVPQGLKAPLRLAKSKKNIAMQSNINDECFDVIAPFDVDVETKGYDPNFLSLKNYNESEIYLNDNKNHFFVLEFYEKVLEIPFVKAFNLNDDSEFQNINCEKSSLHNNIIICGVNKNVFKETKEEKIYGIYYYQGCEQEVFIPNINIYLNKS